MYEYRTVLNTSMWCTAVALVIFVALAILALVKRPMLPPNVLLWPHNATKGQAENTTHRRWYELFWSLALLSAIAFGVAAGLYYHHWWLWFFGLIAVGAWAVGLVVPAIAGVLPGARPTSGST